ncbi:MAG: TAXI family TRAP transporter solute-binding subunit [Pseudomonadota bacterium]
MKCIKFLVFICLFLSGLLFMNAFTSGPFVASRAQAADLPAFIQLATNPSGGLLNAIGNGLAKMITEKCPFEVKLRLQTYGFPVVVNSGAAQLALNNSVDSYQAIKGLEAYRGKPQKKIRIAAVAPQFASAFMVKNDSDIRSVTDLKGKKVAGKFTNQPPAYFDGVAALAAVGMKWEDLSVIPVSSVKEGNQVLIQGNSVATILAVGSALVQEANVAIKGGIRFLSIPGDPESAKKMWDAVPGYVPLPVKKGFAVGITGDTILTSKSLYLITSQDTNPEIIYEVSKALWNHMETLYTVHPIFKRWTKDCMTEPNITIPYHEGAIRFLKEVQKWTPEMEKGQESALKAGGA